MKIHITVILIFSVLFCLLTNQCTQNKDSSQTILEQRESILDRKVHIEPDLITEIPSVKRWCDRIKIKKYRINVGDAELYVEEEGRGIPLVLINGGPGGTHHYFHTWFSKASEYARVIYYDQRGCGLSDFYAGKDGYSVKQAVDDLEAIRKALKIEKWVVMGYSYGGFLAQFYTVNYPDYLAGLILLGAKPGMWANTGKSREQDYIAEEERQRMREIPKQLDQLKKEKKLSNREYTQILLYNNTLNGDWKRQHFFKPSRERMALSALYEWDSDENFNRIMNSSLSQIDLSGAFTGNPIPTLILEGEYDLTWGTEKTDLLEKNHPEAQIKYFKNAGHNIFDEATDEFFNVLKDFINNLPDVNDSDRNNYREYLIEWDHRRKNTLSYKLRSLGNGYKSHGKLIEGYTRDWLSELKGIFDYLKIGCALYDYKYYDEALFVFDRMQDYAKKNQNRECVALALVWQGHMLDLLGRRSESIALYCHVAGMDLDDLWQFDQFELKFRLSPYAKERIVSPFIRIENKMVDHEDI